MSSACAMTNCVALFYVLYEIMQLVELEILRFTNMKVGFLFFLFDANLLLT
jgi:hypothetical protein